MKCMRRQIFFSEYFAPDTWTREAHIVEILKKKGIKNKLVLDSGCGTGFFTNILDSMSAKTVGIDIIPANVVLTKNNVPRATTVAGNIEKLPLKNEMFDLILCTEVLEHCKNDKETLEEFYRVLKPHGTLVLTVPNTNYNYSFLENWLNGIFRRLTDYVYTTDHEELHHNFYTPLKLTQKIEKGGFRMVSSFTVRKTISILINKIFMITERIDRLLRHRRNLEMHLASHKVRKGVFLRLYKKMVLPIIKKMIKLDYVFKRKEGACIFLIATK